MAYEEPRADSIANVFRQIIDDIRELTREELALARAELRQEASVFTHSAIDMAAAVGFAMFAAFFFLLGIAQLCGRWWNVPNWAAYLIVGIVLGCVSIAALLMSRARMAKTNVVPPRTAESLEETKEWLQHRMTSNTK